MADVVFGALHVVGERAEGHLRLDHPELGEVARRVRVLGAEGRAEGVDVGEGARVVLAVELAGHGEERGPAEKVGGVVDRRGTRPPLDAANGAQPARMPRRVDP